MKDILKLVGIVLLLVLVITIPFLSWYVGRRLNYSFMYKSLVQETIRQTVKAEALK